MKPENVIRWLVLVVAGGAGLVVGIWLDEPSTKTTIVASGLTLAVLGIAAALIGPRRETIAKTAVATWPLMATGFAAFGLLLAGSAYIFQGYSTTKADFVKADVRTLTSAVLLFKQKTGAYPTELRALMHPPDGGLPYLNSEDNLTDWWGRPYDYDPHGPRNKGKHPDIWTVSPSGELIGNWMMKK